VVSHDAVEQVEGLDGKIAADDPGSIRHPGIAFVAIEKLVERALVSSDLELGLSTFVLEPKLVSVADTESLLGLQNAPAQADLNQAAGAEVAKLGEKPGGEVNAMGPTPFGPNRLSH
jgi:hypothetical protein